MRTRRQPQASPYSWLNRAAEGITPSGWLSGATVTAGTAVVYTRQALLYRHVMTEGAPRPEQALRLLGDTIRAFRKQRGLTQRALAARVGLASTYVSAIERGQRNVTIGTLLHIAAALQIPLSTLLQPLEARPDLYALPPEESL